MRHKKLGCFIVFRIPPQTFPSNKNRYSGLRLIGLISCGLEVVVIFFVREEVEDVADCVSEVFVGSGGGLLD